MALMQMLIFFRVGTCTADGITDHFPTICSTLERKGHFEKPVLWALSTAFIHLHELLLALRNPVSSFKY
jgi:hypothetical protein